MILGKSVTRVVRPGFGGAACFALLLVTGIAIRVYALVAYPVVLTPQVHDAAAYVRAARTSLASGTQEPLGYPLFLRTLHAISHHLSFTIAVQHALGLATGALLFGALRRLSAPVWVSLVPAAVVWLCGDQLFLEHAPLSEALFTFLLAATIYAAARALGGGVGWPALAGGLAACTLTVRTVGVPLPALVVVWLGVALWRGRIPWRRAVGGALAAAILMTVAYAALRHHETGRSTVLVDGSGWMLYARAAEFADCHDFTPPRGTKMLCDDTPPGQRPGPGYYLYFGGPARAAFGEPARHDSLVAAFARTAIVHQPLDYFKLVGIDLGRYVVPSFGGHRLDDYVGPSGIEFRVTRPEIDPQTRQQVTAYYGSPRAAPHAATRRMADYQDVLRLSGVVMVALLILALAGTLAARGAIRWLMLLLLGASLELIVVPALTHGEWRYVVPAEGPTAAAAALGAWCLMQTPAIRRPRRTRRTEVAAAADQAVPAVSADA